MRHQVIRTVREWRALRTEWSALLAASRANQVFTTWEWLNSWLSVHPEVDDLLVICVRDAADRLAGVAPYYRTGYRLLGVVPYRALRLHGDANCGAEYQMWVVRTADEQAVCGEIARALYELRSEWDLLWMPNVCSWSGVHTPMIRALTARRLCVRTRPQGFSSIPLPADLKTYLARMSPERRRQLRSKTGRILSKSGVTVRKVTAPDEVGPALHALFRLHRQRWRSVGIEGVFDRNPRERAFYERFVPEALARGWLAMFVLYDGAEPKAAQIGYIYNNAFLQLQDGFDPDCPHAGNALRMWIIQYCIDSGLAEYDFLGGHSEHKRRWQAVERSGEDVLCMNHNLRGLVLRAGIWPTGSYLRPLAGRSPAERLEPRLVQES